MPERDEPRSDHEERVGEAVAWYFQSFEAGSPPDPAAFLARFPDLRPELESFLADSMDARAPNSGLLPVGSQVVLARVSGWGVLFDREC